jgi:hypothetical protein
VAGRPHPAAAERAAVKATPHPHKVHSAEQRNALASALRKLRSARAIEGQAPHRWRRRSVSLTGKESLALLDELVELRALARR